MNVLCRLVACSLVGFLLASCTGGLSGGSLAERDNGGESYFVVESNSGVVLSKLSPRSSRPIGELTQVATAVVAFDWSTATSSSLSTLATVPMEAASLGGGNPMGLMPGDQIRLRDALYSMLLGADAVSAQTVATYVGTELARQRGGYGQPISIFVTEMNQLASALGMSGTRFTSPHGLDGTTSTAEDVARLGVYAMRHPGLAFYVKQKSRRISFYRGGQAVAFDVSNTNPLVGQGDINGIKAGSTTPAGASLLISAERKPIVEKLPGGQSRVTPRRLVIVVLRSLQGESRAMGLREVGWAQYDQWLASGGSNSAQVREMLTVPNP
ncbi:MAG: hypothetical protein Q7Q71_10265 [Verrucomicrobiota bacterium JB023]|nr:hypothetical protein [Verrucomicrobiota bacterium JB023]